MTTSLLWLLFACGEPPTAAQPARTLDEPPRTAEPSEPEAKPHWVRRTDLEMDTLIKATCAASLVDGKPILLEFSAPWCVDCRTLNSLTTKPVLSSRMEQIHHIVVDVGRWEHHQQLAQAFDVSALAWWVVVAPDDCEAPIPRWRRLSQGGFEPASTGRGGRTAEGVARWLDEALSRRSE